MCSEDGDNWATQREFLEELLQVLKEYGAQLPICARAAHQKLVETITKRLNKFHRDVSMSRMTLQSTKKHVGEAKDHLRRHGDGKGR